MIFLCIGCKNMQGKSPVCEAVCRLLLPGQPDRPLQTKRPLPNQFLKELKISKRVLYPDAVIYSFLLLLTVYPSSRGYAFSLLDVSISSPDPKASNSIY